MEGRMIQRCDKVDDAVRRLSRDAVSDARHLAMFRVGAREALDAPRLAVVIGQRNVRSVFHDRLWLLRGLGRLVVACHEEPSTREPDDARTLSAIQLGERRLAER